MSAQALMLPGIAEEETRTPSGAISSAIFDSRRRERRYLLTRIWDRNVEPAVVVMLNPSTAGADKDDATVRRLAGENGFARSWGKGGVIVVNLFSLCSTNPERLRTHPDPVGKYNGLFVAEAVKQSSLVVAAWGGGGVLGNRGFDMARSLHQAGVRLKALKVTSTGQPGHPLYVPADTKLIDYLPEGS